CGAARTEGAPEVRRLLGPHDVAILGEAGRPECARAAASLPRGRERNTRPARPLSRAPRHRTGPDFLFEAKLAGPRRGPESLALTLGAGSGNRRKPTLVQRPRPRTISSFPRSRA